MVDENFNPSYILLRKNLVDLVQGNHLCILDVGCATGVNGKYLLEKQIAEKVIGIEYDTEMAKEAAEEYEEVLVGDLNSQELRNKVKQLKEQFDYIICGDILEHLLDVESILKIFQEKLKPKGKIIISVPNIQHIETFVQLYFHGYWPRNERGIFDKTHVTWFTKKNLYEFIENAGLRVISYKPKYRGRDDVKSLLSKIQSALRIKFKYFVFQHVVVCEKNV